MTAGDLIRIQSGKNHVYDLWKLELSLSFQIMLV